MNNNNNTEEKRFPNIDVLIVGAGLSGLVAAYKILLKEPSLKVLILEANDNVGGQIEISASRNLGGKWFTEDQYHIYNLCKDLNVRIKRRNILRNDLKRYWEIDDGIFSKIAKYELNRVIQEIDLKSKQYAPGTFKINRNSQTMEKFVCSRLFFEKSRNFLRLFIRLFCGVEAEHITFTEFMGICYSSGGISEFITLFTGGSNSLLEFSSEELFCCLQDFINTDYIIFKSEITEVIHYADYVLVHDKNEQKFFTSVLILALPWQRIQSIKIYPSIPNELRVPIYDNKCMITSFIAKYPDGWWRQSGFSGSLILHNLNMICYELKPTVYGGVILHDEDFEQILKPIILQKLSNCFGVEMNLPSHWSQKTWEQSMLLNLPPTTSWNRVIWASSCCGTSYRGCLSGAVQSGLRAAIQTLLILRPQNVHWQDIEEIQRANIIRPQISWMDLFMSSINFYNTTFYILLLAGVLVPLKLRKNLMKFW